MPPLNLDVTDLDVLAAIAAARAETGRCSIVEVAQRVGMSRKGVTYRLEIMRGRGIVWWEGRGPSSTIHFGLPAEAAQTFEVTGRWWARVNKKGERVDVDCG